MRDAAPLPASAPQSPQPRQALLINPFYPKDPHGSFGKHVLTPTLALTSIAAATPPGWQVNIWDENLLQGPPPHQPLPQVVGITVHLTFADRAYALADAYRHAGAIVVLGGLHTLACPDEAQAHADVVAIGDGVQLWGQILRDIDAGALRSRYLADYTAPYADATPPHRHLLPRSSFLTTASIVATRGCHNRCGFCYLSTGQLRMPYQTLAPTQVVAQVQAAGEPYFVFTDNGSDRNYLRRLCHALAPLQRIWSAAVSLDVCDEPDLPRTMAQAGCTAVFVGFETLSDTNLARAGKHGPAAADYLRRVELFHRCGIQVNGSFVFGFDDDGPDVFAETVAWIEQARLECATFHILTPYPGTPLFRQMERENRLLHRDWRLYDTAHAVFRPRRMSPAELEAGYAWTYRRLFSLASIWRRRPTALRAVPAYLAMAYLYKKCNWLWPWLIRYRLTRAACSPHRTKPPPPRCVAPPHVARCARLPPARRAAVANRREIASLARGGASPVIGTAAASRTVDKGRDGEGQGTAWAATPNYGRYAPPAPSRRICFASPTPKVIFVGSSTPGGVARATSSGRSPSWARVTIARVRKSRSRSRARATRRARSNRPIRCSQQAPGSAPGFFLLLTKRPCHRDALLWNLLYNPTPEREGET
jgi:radical SAM superfamily enzyme YgiQ (UPF0313 family)